MLTMTVGNSDSKQQQHPSKGGGGGKPPPPVPPRPSKSVVAEALAKTRYQKAAAPSRQAPPPPIGIKPELQGRDLSKSSSCHSTTATNLKKLPDFERSISEELKNCPRPVVYQSRVKVTDCTSNHNNNNIKLQVTCTETKNINSSHSIEVKSIGDLATVKEHATRVTSVNKIAGNLKQNRGRRPASRNDYENVTFVAKHLDTATPTVIVEGSNKTLGDVESITNNSVTDKKVTNQCVDRMVSNTNNGVISLEENIHRVEDSEEGLTRTAVSTNKVTTIIDDVNIEMPSKQDVNATTPIKRNESGVNNTTNLKCVNSSAFVEDGMHDVTTVTGSNVAFVSNVVNNAVMATNISKLTSVTRSESQKSEDRRVNVARKNSANRRSFCGDILKQKVDHVETETHIISTARPAVANRVSISSYSPEPNDERKWQHTLSDRNHVNTLIDEMFASVLEVQQSDEIPLSETMSPSDAINKIVISSTASERSERECDSIKEDVPKTVIVIKEETDKLDEGVGQEKYKQVKFKDQLNHEHLIDELQCMKKDQQKILKRQRKPSRDIYEQRCSVVSNSSENIFCGDSVAKIVDCENGEIVVSRDSSFRKPQRPNYLDVVKNGSSEKSSFRKDKEYLELDFNRLTSMSSLHGLPPLPKSLSGFSLPDTGVIAGQIHPHAHRGPSIPLRSSSYSKTANDVEQGKKTTQAQATLEAKLAVLRQEMYSLRQLDLSLLSQLWSLNESIQDFRQMLQEHHNVSGHPGAPHTGGIGLSPPASPSPTPSSGDDDGDFYVSATSLNYVANAVQQSQMTAGKD